MSNHTRSRRHQPPKPKPPKGQLAMNHIVGLHGAMHHGGDEYDARFVICPCDRMSMVICNDCNVTLAAFADRSNPCEHLLALEADGLNLTWSTEKLR